MIVKPDAKMEEIDELSRDPLKTSQILKESIQGRQVNRKI